MQSTSSRMLSERTQPVPAASRSRNATASHPKTGDGALGRKSVNVDVEADVTRGRKVHWLAENQDALDSSNRYVEQHGLPLYQHRCF
jgi:hypothetical protein